MAYEFKVVRQIEFSETDMAGIVHFSNFFRYMETAEHAFYRSLGLSVQMPHLNPPLGFPRVHAACDYKKPVRFEDLLEIHLLVKEKRSRVLSYFFRFTRIPPEGSSLPPELAATGVLTVVCVAHHPDGRMEAVAMPPMFTDKITVAPPELFAV